MQEPPARGVPESVLGAVPGTNKRIVVNRDHTSLPRRIGGAQNQENDRDQAAPPTMSTGMGDADLIPEKD